MLVEAFISGCSLQKPLPEDFSYVEPSLNYQGNYHNYVYKALESLLPLKSLNFQPIVEEKMLTLPETDERKTLILDLDETLIHADFDKNFSHHDTVISFRVNGEDYSVAIFIRPGLFEFLHCAAQKFEIFVFTASIKEYADAILNFLDPENRIFRFRFYREDCINVKNRFFIKDLRIFLNRKPEHMILVDNSLYSFTNQISNGVLINSFYNDKEDKELFNLLSYLDFFQNESDIRSVNDAVFNFASILGEISD